MQPAGPADPAAADPVPTVAAHVSPAFDESIALSRRAMRAGRGLDHLSYYSSGVFHYGFDRPADTPAPSGEETAYVNAGRRLAFAVEGLDRRLTAVSTGRLIRTVLHGEAAVLFCHSVLPGEHLVAVARTRTPPGSVLPEVARVREADRAVAELTTALREHVSLSTQNPGGWLTQRPPSRAPEPHGPGLPPPRTRGEAPGDLAGRIANLLDPSVLSYVAYHRGGVEFSADCFDHPAAARYFGHATPAARRRFYSEWSARFPQLAGELVQAARKALGGPPLRIVLDVEQGAIYYFRLHTGEHLFGVTLNQSEVATADDLLGRLAAELTT